MYKLNVRPLENAYLISTNQTVLVVDRAFVLEHGGPPRGSIVDELEKDPIHEFITLEVGQKCRGLGELKSAADGTIVIDEVGSLLQKRGIWWVDLETQISYSGAHNLTIVRVGWGKDD